MTSTEKSNGQQQIVQHKLIPKSSKNNNNSIKKDDLTDPDEDEQFNEVLDDRISENDNNGDNIDNMLKDNDTIAGNITSNEEFNESSNQHQPTQRAKRDINFNYIGIIKAARSSQNLSNYSFIPFGRLFRIKVYLAGICLCSQKINKYSNKSIKGYKRMI